MGDKFNVIDHATFQQMQQATTSVSSRKIRNGKYKRTSAGNNFSLLQFVKSNKPRRGTGLVKKDKVRTRTVVDTHEFKKAKKGKQRENGKVRKPSRLKKSILQYRQIKRQQADKQEGIINGALDKLEQLNINTESEDKEKVVATVHSRKFRSYCNCCTTPELKKHCEQLVRNLNFFQRRAFAQNEIKARAHRRFVVGFRQTENYLRINKIKLVIIATDCEYNEGDISLDQTIENIKTMCNDQKISVAFALQRRELAYFLYKKASISCIGILDYDGARDTFNQLLEALKGAREKYESILLNNSM